MRLATDVEVATLYVYLSVCQIAANRDTGNIRGLNLAAVKHTTVQVTRLLL
jgi:hypothetical protein